MSAKQNMTPEKMTISDSRIDGNFNRIALIFFNESASLGKFYPLPLAESAYCFLSAFGE
jgi:hypothetical protein